MISGSLALAFASAFAGAGVLRKLGRAAGAPRAGEQALLNEWGPSDSRGVALLAALRAHGGDGRLHLLFRIAGRALGVRRAHRHFELALCVLRHGAAEQPDPVAAGGDVGGGARARPPVGPYRDLASPRSALAGASPCSCGRFDRARNDRRLASPPPATSRDALRFFTRLPLPASRERGPLDFNRFAWAAPLAGAIVGLVGGPRSSSPRRSACRRSWARPCDGRARRQRPARCTRTASPTSRTGSAAGRRAAQSSKSCATAASAPSGRSRSCLSLLLRVGALGGARARARLLARGRALVVAAALSRAGALTPLALLTPARVDGAGAAAGRLQRTSRRRLGLAPHRRFRAGAGRRWASARCLSWRPSQARSARRH